MKAIFVYWSVKTQGEELMRNFEFLRKLALVFQTMVNNGNPSRSPKSAWELTRSKTPIRHPKVKEACAICLKKTDTDRMLSLHDCAHKRCNSCLKKYFKVKLQEGCIPTCSQEGCKSSIKIRSCRKVLSSEMMQMVEQRLKEAQVPAQDRIYCPYPKCSNLMSKAEVLRHSKRGLGKNVAELGCRKCGGKFCVRCKVPWHDGITCADYKKAYPYSCAGEEMLVSLAKRHAWRQCVRCSHMIELSAGCYHMICRCGCQFCYTCGLEWKNGKPCGCPVWNEGLIVYNN